MKLSFGFLSGISTDVIEVLWKPEGKISAHILLSCYVGPNLLCNPNPST